MAIAYHLRMEGLSLNQVGAKIKRDHSTVHYLVEKCRDLISVRDRRTIEAVENFQQVLQELKSWFIFAQWLKNVLFILF